MAPNDDDSESIDLDDILPQVGEFGRFQKLMLWLVCLPACFPCGFCAFNQLFMTNVPEHWCKMPELGNMTVEEWKHSGIPRENGTFSKCSRFKMDLETMNSTMVLEKCLDGWEYNTSQVVSSIVIDFDLVCDRDIYPTLGLTALNLGGPIGVYIFGHLNDGIGRRKSFFTCLATLIVGNVLTAASPNFWWWAASRFIAGLSVPAIYQIPFIISLELVGPSYRTFVTVMTCIFYTFGLMMLAAITYFIRNWAHLALITSTPFCLYVFYWFFLPESPRWLLTQGRYEDALQILENLAKINETVLPDEIKRKLKQKSMVHVKDENGPGFWALCATPNMRLKTALITLNWFANETVYVGLSYYGPSLGSNEYLSFLLSSAVEIPSYMACWALMDRWGRRWPLCVCMVISGISCIGTVMLPADATTTILILYLIAKSAISASFLIIYPFAGELYPTQLRGIGIGTSAYIGGLGLIIIPFITYLGSENLILPLIIMGTVSVLGGLFGLRLPETLHYKLPQTIEEGENFGKDFALVDCFRCVPLRPGSSISGSYEDLELESIPDGIVDDVRKNSMKKLVRQTSFMNTQKDVDGTMKLTYWF